MAQYCVGDRFWIYDEQHAWLSGVVQDVSPNILEFLTDRGIQKINLKKIKFKLEPCGSHLEDNVENLVDLDELSEGAILHHVRTRFRKNIIYTHVGSILVAVNPFQVLNIYGKNEIDRASKTLPPYPHVYVTAATAYQQMCNNNKNQSVLISGESGAGKTETTKKVLAFLANVAPDTKIRDRGETGMEEKILQSNPLLEALGNAKTLRNNNSSRFGKWMKVGFDNKFKIQGCEIVNYLLEKSRVVHQSPNERNYHIFYQLLAGCDETIRSQLQLLPAQQYHYLNRSGCFDIPGVNERQEFQDVMQSMHTLQFQNDTIYSLLQVIAGILFLGNIQFENGLKEDTTQITPSSDIALQRCSALLGVDPKMMVYALTNRTVHMARASMVSIPLTTAQAIDGRDTLSKSLYSNLFDWTIRKVNQTLDSEGGNSSPYSIGILDIFGFEVFDLNSFEQLCINYANEKLQYHFNEVIFHEESLMYEQEGISADQVAFEDNEPCVNLIEGKPYGLLKLLDDECALGNGTDLTFISKAEKAFGVGKPNENKYFVKDRLKMNYFSVNHFAGPVEYCVDGFLDKNRDTLNVTPRELMEQSQIKLVTELYFLTENFGDETLNDGQSPRLSKHSGKPGVKSTLGGQFRNQLVGLVQNLKKTEPHFIRCVKPNHDKLPSVLDSVLALRQLRYAGLFEAIRIRKSGYSYRATFRIFANSYSILIDGLSRKRKLKRISDQDACHEILNSLTQQRHIEKSFWHIGTTKIFLKTNLHRTILERLKLTRTQIFAIRIQKVIRGFNARMQCLSLRDALAKIKRKQEFERMKTNRAAIVIQKHWRRVIIRMAMSSMEHLIELRQAFKKRETARVIELLKKIDRVNEKPPTTVSELFKHEVKVAKVMLRLIEIQDQLVDDLKIALNKNDIHELNSLLIKSERLEMSSHPMVLLAKDKLLLLHNKRKVLRTMINYLKNQDQYNEIILNIIDEATSHDIDQKFIDKVRRAYDNAGPRLKSRTKLRVGIETLDRYVIEQGCIEVLNIQQKHQPNFAEAELRAAKMMLRLIHFDSQLDFNHHEDVDGKDSIQRINPQLESVDATEDAKPVNTSIETNTKGASSSPSINSLWNSPILKQPNGPKLPIDIIEICEKINYASNINESKHWKKMLQTKSGNLSQFYDYIRYFKWSKVICSWKFPEVTGNKYQVKEDLELQIRSDFTRNQQNPSNSREEFYGLRSVEARSCSYIIRSLHKDFDSQFGSGSALMQAALGASEVPASISQILENLDALNDINLNIPLPNGQVYSRNKNQSTIKKKLVQVHSHHSNPSVVLRHYPSSEETFLRTHNPLAYDDKINKTFSQNDEDDDEKVILSTTISPSKKKNVKLNSNKGSPSERATPTKILSPPVKEKLVMKEALPMDLPVKRMDELDKNSPEKILYNSRKNISNRLLDQKKLNEQEKRYVSKSWK